MGQIAYEFKEEMSRSLYESYLEILNTGECSTQYEAIERTRKSPAPHFFTSARNCAYILKRITLNEPTGLRNFDKIRKFNDLYALAEKYKMEHPEYPGLMAVSRIIVNMPAPEYYICHNTAKQIILRERKRRREEVARKWGR